MDYIDMIALGYLNWNLVVFIIYGIDKLNAKKNWRRVSEIILILSSFAMGAIGAIIGMVVFHHKVSKVLFKIFIPISVILNLLVIYFVFIFKH